MIFVLFFFFSLKEVFLKLYFLIFSIMILFFIRLFLINSIYYDYIYYPISFITISIEYFLFVKSSIFFNFGLKTYIRFYDYLKIPVYIIDSSCIMDNRLNFLIKEHVIKGVFIIYDFIYEELKRIATKEENKNNIIIENMSRLDELKKKYPLLLIETKKNEFRGPVDDKLIYYTRKNRGILITNDYELYQKAKMFEVEVIDINIIANNMKILKVPGDRVCIKIIKDGKEPDQGVGYLEDGTMVVVHQGKEFLGKNINVVIDSVIQTPAGRILFGKKIDDEVVSENK
ncbi:MAG: hypothetical protein N3A58_02670 [Spirochaetes bacterium]|nr:hypothetical protein [Spirochaetota bacterium]